MAVFNCSPSEFKVISEFTVKTQNDDLPTGELLVTDSLKIKGGQGVGVSVDGDTVLLGIDESSFPEDLSPTIEVEPITAEEPVAAVMSMRSANTEGVTVTNYLVNGNFADSTGWNATNNGVLSVENNKATVTIDGSTSDLIGLNASVSKDIMTQKNGDVWFLKIHIVPDISEPLPDKKPNARLALNAVCGFLSVDITNASSERDVYCTHQLTADGTIDMLFVARVDYASGNTIARTAVFSHAVLVNLTEAYGAGNEPTADEFYEILSAYDNCYFDGTVTIGSDTGGGDDNTGEDTGGGDTGGGGDGNGGEVEPPVVIPPTGDGYRITITDSKGTQSFDLYHGADGEDGYSPTIEIEETADGKQLVITDANGEKNVELPQGGSASIIATNAFANGNFATTDGWTALNSAFAVEDNTAILTGTGASNFFGVQYNMGAIEKADDIWYFQYRASIPLREDGLHTYARMRMNTNDGMKNAFNILVDGSNEFQDYYGTLQFLSTINANKTIQIGADYVGATHAAEKVVKIKNILAINLTETFGAGNEPAANEVYALLKGFENQWFSGKADLFDINQNVRRVLENDKKTLQSDIVVTVGENGDFVSLNHALSYLSQFYPTYKNGGLNCEIKILAGTTITEQVAVVQIDMQYITITSEDSVVPVDSTGWSTNGLDAHDLRGDVGFIGGENAAKLPTIGTVFQLVTKGEKPAVGYFANRGSEGVVLAGCGFDGFYDGVIANNESSVTIREGISRNMERWGVHSRHNGEISARSCICTNCGIAAYADRVADLDVREADLSNSKQAIVAEHTSRINANGCHANGCGNDTTYSVTSGNGSVVNCTSLEVTNSVGDIFSVSNGGTIIAFTPTTTGLAEGKKAFSQEKNAIFSAGIIYG